MKLLTKFLCSGICTTLGFVGQGEPDVTQPISMFPVNKELLQGTVPVNKELLTATVPVNKELLPGTVPVNNSVLNLYT
jgi:hypothetical protein